MSRKRGRGHAPPRQNQNLPAHHGRRDRAELTEQALRVEQTYYAGPLPAPDDLERYAQIDPNAVPLILGNFNEQGRHRRALEGELVRGVEKRADRGQFIGAVLVLSGIIGGCVVAVMGQAVAGASISGAAFASAAIVFVVGGRPNTPEGS